MKMFIFIRSLAITLFVFAAIAQTASPNKMPNDSGLKITDFSFENKVVSRYEPVAVEGNNGIAARALAMGAENGKEPNNSQYYRTEKRTEQRRYATLRVKNEGAKEINSVVWEYTDPHFKGDSEVIYTETKTKIKIAPGQSAVLSASVAQNYCHSGLLVKNGNSFLSGVCGRRVQKRTAFYPVEAKLKQVNYKDGAVWKAQ
jgi:hypothetical protein